MQLPGLSRPRFSMSALRNQQSTMIMAVILLVLGFFLIYPIILIIILSFNTSEFIWFGDRQWGLDNWRLAWEEPRLFKALGNTMMIWGLVVAISFPLAVLISWTLARTNIPFSHGLEFLFWISFLMPGISTTLAWMTLMDPRIGILNKVLEYLPFIDKGPFNIFSVEGIVWAHLMANGISTKVMLLTPSFRNMDAALEESARVSGASNLKTMLRITLPLMAAPMMLILALQMLRILSGFEIEQLLGVPIGFFVYSTLIFQLIRENSPPLYGQATVLASLTLLVVMIVVPLQRWVTSRRRYTTITGQFKPGLIDLGAWRYPIFGAIITLISALTIMPALTLVLGSFMKRSGYFNITPVFSLHHWQFVVTDNLFIQSLQTTLIIAVAAAIASPLLFVLLAYILVRTKWRGRVLLDLIIWGSAAIPGILGGLGLLLIFLGTPGLSFLFGSIWALIIVVVLSGNTTGVNISKAVLVQIGTDMEEAARVSGAGWTRTYIRVVLPLLTPTLILLATLNFVSAAGATSSVILLASRESLTLSILALEYAGVGYLEEANVVGLFVMGFTTVVVVIARHYGLKLGIQHDQTRKAGDEPSAPRKTREVGAESAPTAQSTSATDQNSR